MTVANDDVSAPTAWAGRAAEDSPSVQRSRARSLERATQIVDAAHRLVVERGGEFTTNELAKEAGVAIQTFYTYFKSKDQVLLAVIEDMIIGACKGMRERGAQLPDPVARLRFYVTGIMEPASEGDLASPSARFVTTQHWRLQQLHPVELEAATRHFTDLLAEGLQEAVDQGLLAPADVEGDAWLANQMIMAVFHHSAFAVPARSPAELAQNIWSFCYAAWSGPPKT